MSRYIKWSQRSEKHHATDQYLRQTTSQETFDSSTSSQITLNIFLYRNICLQWCVNPSKTQNLQPLFPMSVYICKTDRPGAPQWNSTTNILTTSNKFNFPSFALLTLPGEALLDMSDFKKPYSHGFATHCHENSIYQHTIKKGVNLKTCSANINLNQTLSRTILSLKHTHIFTPSFVQNTSMPRHHSPLHPIHMFHSLLLNGLSKHLHIEILYSHTKATTIPTTKDIYKHPVHCINCNNYYILIPC